MTTIDFITDVFCCVDDKLIQLGELHLFMWGAILINREAAPRNGREHKEKFNAMVQSHKGAKEKIIKKLHGSLAS